MYSLFSFPSTLAQSSVPCPSPPLYDSLPPYRLSQFPHARQRSPSASTLTPRTCLPPSFSITTILCGATNKKQQSLSLSSPLCVVVFDLDSVGFAPPPLSAPPLHHNPARQHHSGSIPMRIRKRQVPLPLSSLSPVPLSDPNLLSLNHCSSSPPLVQPPQQQQPHIHQDPKPSQRLHDVGPLPPQPSDHPNRRLLPPIGASSNDGSGSDFCWELKKRNYCAVSEIIHTHIWFLLD